MKKSSFLWSGAPCALVLTVAGYLAGPEAIAPNVGDTRLNGSKHRLADLRGQVVLVSFWATDCAPCVQEMPALVLRTIGAPDFAELHGPIERLLRAG
jgi:thiol-disulfide isomerase/thioredoxin